MADEDEDRDTLLQFLFSEWWNLKLGKRRLLRFIISLLPKPRLHSLAEDSHVAERFEFYYKGLELPTVSMSSPMHANNNTALKKTIVYGKNRLATREIDYRF